VSAALAYDRAQPTWTLAGIFEALSTRFGGDAEPLDERASNGSSSKPAREIGSRRSAYTASTSTACSASSAACFARTAEAEDVTQERC
jgi:hypothetical protein